MSREMQGLAALAGSQRARLEEAAVRRIEDQNRHRRIVESMRKEHAEQLRALLRSVGGPEFHVHAARHGVVGGAEVETMAKCRAGGAGIDDDRGRRDQER